MLQQSDLAIIGGGIVGLATAYRFQQRLPGKSVVVIEKEPTLARHQSGRNSGVLHSGIYYRPGSLKAQNCRAGKLAMEEFCRQQEIAFDICGKVIVALEESELARMEKILANGQANGVACERIDRARLRELEPHAAGIAAIHVPEAGIVDYGKVADRLVELIREQGGRVVTATRVVELRREEQGIILVTSSGEFSAAQVVNCAGLYSDRITRMSGAQPSARIIPFRGEFYSLRPAAHHLVRALIYPVPDPQYPFLGVHFTRRIDGSVECGPNAVLAYAREGYRHRNFNPRDLAEVLTYPGFWKLAARYWRTGFEETWRSLSKRAFVRALRRLVPEIEGHDLDWAPAGVRAQAVNRDGTMVDDFLINEVDRVINVENAPSPAATASLNIGRLIVDRIAPRFQ